MSSRAKLNALSWLGNFANSLGVPGFIKDTEYQSKEFGTTVRVKRGHFYTVVTVNGVDVYFDRFNGEIDGVGFSPASDCTPDLTARSVRSAVESVRARQREAQSQIRPARS